MRRASDHSIFLHRADSRTRSVTWRARRFVVKRLSGTYNAQRTKTLWLATCGVRPFRWFSARWIKFVSQYLEETCGALTRVLNHACQLHAHRLAGYAANMDFWMAEVRHCLDLVAGYGPRFDKLKKATKEFGERHYRGLDPAGNQFKSGDYGVPNKRLFIRVTRTMTNQEL